MNTKIIKFASPDQVVLYELELKGQISDGFWENSRPYDHWHCMCDATAITAPAGDGVAMNFTPRRKYNFADPELLEAVGQRMINYVRMRQRLGFDRDQIRLARYLFDLDGNPTGLPTYTGKYWDDVRENLKKIDANAVLQAVADTRFYGMKDLKRDLREMSKIVNQR